MRDFMPCRAVLPLVLVASVALAEGPDDRLVIRPLKLSEHPSDSTHNIYVSGQVVTVLRFDQKVDPTKTRLLGWEGRFEPMLVGGKKVVIEALRNLGRDEGVPLLAVIHLTNTGNEEPWRFRDARLTSDLTSHTARPFALRVDRAELVQGQSGTIAVVADESAFTSKEGLRDLALEIFREDGLRQVIVNLDHTLIRK
jgi:hypothetical protein